MPKKTFNKTEKLTSKTAIEAIFKKGDTIKNYPLILKYISYEFNDGAAAKVVITVPKKKVKRAAKRNRLRRQLKEAYRLNKFTLIQQLKQSETSLALFFIYTGEEKVEYSFLEEKIKVILKKVEQNLPQLH